ncbi:unnamed protein product [Leuciscus chuanchicus]
MRSLKTRYMLLNDRSSLRPKEDTGVTLLTGCEIMPFKQSAFLLAKSICHVPVLVKASGAGYCGRKTSEAHRRQFPAFFNNQTERCPPQAQHLME